MVQDAVDRWWWPSLMMFGPPDGESPNSRAVDALGHQADQQRRPAAEVRRRRPSSRPRSSASPCPTPICAGTRSASSHDFGAIDWNEFWQVVGGDGPCNRERLAARVKAWDDGAWVRDAALVHAAKRELKEAA